MALVDNVQALPSAEQIANYLLCESRERGEILSNLKLQKLLFYADAWCMALHDHELVQEEFQAWVHGPVLVSQYRRFKDFRWHPIEQEIERPVLSEAISAYLNEVVDVFGSETAVALELMTHREPPWLQARGDLAPSEPSSARISKAITRDYYRSLP